MNMKVKIAGVEFKNPVMTASGTFGSGAEYSEFVDLNQLGAVVTKGVANVPWAGNATPRIAEVHSGMMNAIGLQNPGIDVFCERDIPFLQQFDTKVIVNVCGHAPEEYLAVVERLAEEPIDMMEINISCPNVNANFLAFGQNPKHVEELTAQIKKVAKQPVIMKLTPNVTDIAEIARAAEAGGSEDSHYWNGWYPECRRCSGIYYGRSNRSVHRNCKLYKSICNYRSDRWYSEVYGEKSDRRYSRADRLCEIKKL